MLGDCYALTVAVDPKPVAFLSGQRAVRWAVFERTAYYIFRSLLRGRRDSFLPTLLPNGADGDPGYLSLDCGSGVDSCMGPRRSCGDSGGPNSLLSLGFRPPFSFS